MNVSLGAKVAKAPKKMQRSVAKGTKAGTKLAAEVRAAEAEELAANRTHRGHRVWANATRTIDGPAGQLRESALDNPDAATFPVRGCGWPTGRLSPALDSGVRMSPSLAHGRRTPSQESSAHPDQLSPRFSCRSDGRAVPPCIPRIGAFRYACRSSHGTHVRACHPALTIPLAPVG